MPSCGGAFRAKTPGQQEPRRRTARAALRSGRSRASNGSNYVSNWGIGSKIAGTISSVGEVVFTTGPIGLAGGPGGGSAPGASGSVVKVRAVFWRCASATDNVTRASAAAGAIDIKSSGSSGEISIPPPQDRAGTEAIESSTSTLMSRKENQNSKTVLRPNTQLGTRSPVCCFAYVVLAGTSCRRGMPALPRQ